MTSILKEIEDAKDLCSGEQKKVDVDSPLSIFYGLNSKGFQRVSFLSISRPPKLESTTNIEISQGSDTTKMYWTHFDLVSVEQQNVFLTFCENLIQSVVYSTSEEQAFISLRRQYAKWRSLFKNAKKDVLDKDLIQGTFGELYFLKNFMIPQYGVEKSVKSWSGADGASKDFSVETLWYEIKTIGMKSSSVKISSLAQLSSNYDGFLVVNKVERMAEEYEGLDCCIKDIFDYVRLNLNDENLESLFFEKLSGLGIMVSDRAMNMKFSVKSTSCFLVNDDFPRLTQENVPYKDIVDAQYYLSIESLKQYEVVLHDKS